MNPCRLCCENKVELLIDFGQQPIVHHLLSDKEEAYLQYPFQLGYCSNCSFVQLLCPISGDVLYENYFSVSSWKNQPHVERLVDVMQSIAGINGHSNVLEIGCNDCSFIDVLSNRGIVNCTGSEPSKDAYDLAVAKGLNVHNTFFTIANCDSMLNAKNYDMIVCRHVLEHISDLHTFLEAVEFYLDDHGTFVIEIPDSSFNLEYMDYALWEEHVNYFTLRTVRNLLRKHGFRIVHHETTLFSGRALIVFAQKQVRQSDYTYITADLDNAIADQIENAIDVLKSLGCKFKDISLPNTHLAVPAYYVIAPAECSSNLARFDGVRFGHRCKNPDNINDF